LSAIGIFEEKRTNYTCGGNALPPHYVLPSEYSLEIFFQWLCKGLSSTGVPVLSMTPKKTNMTAIQVPVTRSASLMHNLSTELRVPGHRLQPYLRLQDDLFLEPLDINLLIASLESKLEYYLTEEEASQVETVGDLQTFFLR
jgi:acyl carrier protein